MVGEGGLSVQQVRESRSMLLDQARGLARSNPNESRQLNDLAESLQTDLDNSMLSGAARQVSSDYRNQVIGPYGQLRKGLTAQSDPEDAWRAILGAGKSDLQRLRAKSSPETINLIRQRVLNDVVTRENAFTTGQAGSGAPIIRQMQAKGMDTFFSPEEWKGLTRVTGRLAQARSPMGKIVKGAVGGAVGASLGHPSLGLLVGERIASMGNTLAGRRFIERMSTAPPREIDTALLALSTIPAAARETAQQELP
jgi:hypothetical protein